MVAVRQLGRGWCPWVLAPWQLGGVSVLELGELPAKWSYPWGEDGDPGSEKSQAGPNRTISGVSTFLQHLLSTAPKRKPTGKREIYFANF